MLFKQFRVSRALTLINSAYSHKKDVCQFISKYILNIKNVFRHVPQSKSHQNMNIFLGNFFKSSPWTLPQMP